MKAKHSTVGPFSPPLPTDVEASRPEPMAVAWDKQQTHGESFVATSAPMDAYDEDVARRYKQVPAKDMMPHSDAEKRRETEHPSGHTDPDDNGFAHPRTEDDEV